MGRETVCVECGSEMDTCPGCGAATLDPANARTVGAALNLGGREHVLCHLCLAGLPSGKRRIFAALSRLQRAHEQATRAERFGEDAA